MYGLKFTNSFYLLLWGSLQPIFSLILTRFYFRNERLNSGKILGSILGMAGMILKITWDYSTQSDEKATNGNSYNSDRLS